jgi:hypothetical protein
MALSWNEIKSRAVIFSKEWENETSEDAEAKSFWDDFFNVFGISRRRVATFETKVTKGNRKDGFIDLLWKGNLLVEHKSAGKDLDRAYQQAIEYFPGLKDHELPKYIIVCNFKTFRIYDLEDDKTIEFKLSEFVSNVQHFAFIAGYQKHIYKEQDPVNIEAALLMGKLHDKLKAVGYVGHPLEVYLVRLLFCLFADDTTIFEKDLFNDYLILKTKEDGSDLAMHLEKIFYVLNTPLEQRLKNLDENENAFPYVNGKLFLETLPPASFDSGMRDILIKCCGLNWSKISPSIFGSMFQSVMKPKERRNLGAHYTSEKNILKLVKPLFLDDLWKEFNSIKSNKNKLKSFHKKISLLKFLDPACGCGNFLVITYRELRKIELAIIKELLKGQQVTNINNYVLCDVDQFYGIEIEEFPAQISQVAMWLIDHQMNLLFSNEFGEYFVRLPLIKSARIIHNNALRLDWSNLPEISNTLAEKDKIVFNYIFGNPPFIGKQLQTPDQKSDMNLIMKRLKGSGVLDYVTCWYIKAAEYLIINYDQDSKLVNRIKAAFVSTNSIVQGEQVGILWNELLTHYRIKIHFAHRTFRWDNEAKGKAAVHVVIVGFSNFDINEKFIFEYHSLTSEPIIIKAKNINPYLIDFKDITIPIRKSPICDVPKMLNGSMPNDDGNLILSTSEKIDLIKVESTSKKFIKKFVGAYEFINKKDRWCLWLENVSPEKLIGLHEVLKRINNVKSFREKSTRSTTRELANYPALFGEIRQPKSSYIIVPVVSSENRKYIPIDIYEKDVIVSNLCNTIPVYSLYTFGILSSLMMMVWVKNIAGRLKSDYRLTKDNVYNNFPWPENLTNIKKKIVEKHVQQVLDVRKKFPKCSLSDLYNPLTMPPDLVKAHNELDKAVDLAYRSQPFTDEANRMMFLFELYEKYTADLFTKTKIKKLKKSV